MSWSDPNRKSVHELYVPTVWESVSLRESGGVFRPLEQGLQESRSVAVHQFEALFEQVASSAEGESSEERVEVGECDDRLLSQIREEAFAEGVKVGRAEAEQVVHELLATERKADEERFRTVEQALHDGFQEAIERTQKKAVAFSLDVARKILSTTAQVNQQYIVDLFQHAFSELGTRAALRIRMSPADYEYLVREGFQNRFGGENSDAEYVADPAIQSGCVVETGYGEVDLRLEQMWEQVRGALFESCK